jgi:hypothetical protein
MANMAVALDHGGDSVVVEPSRLLERPTASPKGVGEIRDRVFDVGEPKVDETAGANGATRRQNVVGGQIAVDHELFVWWHDVKSLCQLIAVIYQPSRGSIPGDALQVVTQVSDAKGDGSLRHRFERGRGDVIRAHELADRIETWLARPPTTRPGKNVRASQAAPS